MPLTQQQIDLITTILTGHPNNVDGFFLHKGLNQIAEAMGDLDALIRINANVPDANALAIITEAQDRVGTACQDIIDLIGWVAPPPGP